MHIGLRMPGAMRWSRVRCTGTGSRGLVGLLSSDQLIVHRAYKDLQMKTTCNTILDQLEGEVPLPRDDRDDDWVGVCASKGSNDADYDPGDGAGCGSEQNVLKVYPVMAGGREKIPFTAKSSGGDRRFLKFKQFFQDFLFISTYEFRLHT